MSDYEFSREPINVPFVKTKNRLIQTMIPEPNTKDILDTLDKIESRSMHGQLPIIWDKAIDFNVYDKVGNKWIDFTSTIFVANVGHSNPELSKAIINQIQKPMLSSYAYGNEIRTKYLKKLLDFAGEPFEKAFLLSAGTEATEAAIKIMRMNAQKIGKRKRGIICIDGNWHGRTLGAQLLSNNAAQNEWIGFKDEDIHHIPFPYPWRNNEISSLEFLHKSLKKLELQGIVLNKDIAGFMLETFQGWGAVFYPKEYVRGIKEICEKHNILLTFDEMQSGFGRTGKNFGYEHYSVKPDLICCGKGMGGGIAISGLLGKSEIMDLPEIGNMSSTHSANPIACAAGLAVIEELYTNNLVEESERKGKLLIKKLNTIKDKNPNNISYVLGQGLLAAVLFKNKKTGAPDSFFASKVAELCMRKGLLVVHTGRESIKIGPPLTISDEALIEGVEVFHEAINEINNK